MRRVKDRPTLTQGDNEQFFNHLKVKKRIPVFLSGKRWRFIYIFAFIATFNFTGNAIAFGMAGVERRFKNFKRSYILKNYPECISPHTALETMWEPNSLSAPSTEKAASTFMELDRTLERGVTRSLLATALHMSNEERLKLLSDSGYEDFSEQLKSSISIKKFLMLVEERAKSEKSEIQYIEGLTTEMRKIAQSKDFEKTQEKAIKMVEETESVIKMARR